MHLAALQYAFEYVLSIFIASLQSYIHLSHFYISKYALALFVKKTALGALSYLAIFTAIV